MKKEEQEPETESDCGNHSLYKPGVSVLSGLVQCIMHCTWEGCALLIDRSSMAVSSGVVGFPAQPIINLDGEVGHLAGHEVQIPKDTNLAHAIDHYGIHDTVEWNKQMGHTIQSTTIVALLRRDIREKLGTAQPLSAWAWCSGLGVSSVQGGV